MFLQRLGIYVEQKRIFICLGRRSSSIFRGVLKGLLLLLVVYVVSLYCGAGDSCRLQIAVHEPEEIILKDNYLIFFQSMIGGTKKPSNEQVLVGPLF